jgi:hypothetical protein
VPEPCVCAPPWRFDPSERSAVATLAAVVILCGKYLCSSTPLVVCGIAILGIYALAESSVSRCRDRPIGLNPAGNRNRVPGQCVLFMMAHAKRRRRTTRAEVMQTSGLARPAGLEPATSGLEIHRSVQLSYGRECRKAM